MRDEVPYDGDALVTYKLYYKNTYDSAYHERGVVYFTGLRNTSELSFRDIHFCLYDSNGTVLNSTNLGNFNGSYAKAPVEISAPEEPYAITIDHPGFYEWDVTTISRVRNEQGLLERYRSSLGNVQDEFLYPRPFGPGPCL